MTKTTPAVRPARPHFSSGPCAKRPGWSPQNFNFDTLGRSHRSKLGKARLAEAIDRTRALLGIPADFRIGIVPASDTGAVEMAMWSMLGARPVDMLAWESFGEGWITDVVKQLKLDARLLKAPYGEIADLSAVDPKHDVVFTWNGTTSGVRVPNADWISETREGVVFCDATSAIFAQALDWAKLDVVTYSWQMACSFCRRAPLNGSKATRRNGRCRNSSVWSKAASSTKIFSPAPPSTRHPCCALKIISMR